MFGYFWRSLRRVVVYPFRITLYCPECYTTYSGQPKDVDAATYACLDGHYARKRQRERLSRVKIALDGTRLLLHSPGLWSSDEIRQWLIGVTLEPGLSQNVYDTSSEMFSPNIWRDRDAGTSFLTHFSAVLEAEVALLESTP